VHDLRQSTIGLEMILDAPDGAPRFEDSANLDAR
jgi:hypothetical protein